MRQCERCNVEIKNRPDRNRFCSKSCSSIGRIKTKEHRENISAAVKKAWLEKREVFSSGSDHVKVTGAGTKTGRLIDNILNCSKRTYLKLIKRFELSCCICGWKEGTIDIHHINGRKIENPHSHSNLTPLCPNHHRLLHNGLLKKEDVISLDKILPENWQHEFYG